MTNTNLLFPIRVGLLCSIAGLFVFLSCQKKEVSTIPQEQSKLLSSAVFHKGVGAPIPGKTGKRWIANWQGKIRGGVSDFIVQSPKFMELISDTSCVGICLYYVQDESSATHLALIGVNSTGNVIRKETVATDAGVVSWATLQAWRKAYKLSNPGAIEAHFFGTNTFLRLIEQQQADQVKASRALNDEGQPQLLLSDAALTDPAGYEDLSGPCPSYCPEGEDFN